ncbi:restriction endonuclease [Pseudomonas lurida]|uniref:restriction endonuclease subunit S n=1 Tax=Pseudomonas lurida TaxID=244566 RepID=UPI00083DCF7A|nr:restriction endonuclease subunit S [Pseudomonas lurida]AOE81391.1 restriction endonuclease [Pseudomonas lurida]
MTALLTDNLPLLADAPNGIKKLRELILELAVRGKLVPQDPSDEPASELLKRIAEENARLVAEGKIKKPKARPEVSEEQFFELPLGWTWCRLQDAFDVRDGTHDTPKYQPSGYPLVTSKNLYTGKLDLTDVKFISEEDHQKISARSKVDRGDILFAMIGSIGNPAIVDTDIPFSIKNVALLKQYAPGQISTDFLLLYLLVAAADMREKSAGGVQSFVSLGSIRLYPFAFPALSEQHRIVAKVDELMTLCDRLEAQQANADSAHAQLVQALLDSLTQASDATEFTANWQRLAEHFHTLFTTEASIDTLKQTTLQLAAMGKLVPQDSNDEPASELLKRIAAEKSGLLKEGKIKKQKSLPLIGETPFNLPESWQWTRLGDLSELITSGSRDWAQYYSEDGAIFVRMGNLSRHSYALRLNSIQRVSPPEEGEGSRTKLEPSDLLLSITGEVGLLGLVPEGFGEAYINQHVCLIRFISSIRSRFLPEMLRSPLAYMQYNAPQRGIKNSFRLGDVSEMLVPLPPLAEQHRIVAKVDQLMILCDQLKTRLTQTRQLNEQLASTLVEQALIEDGQQASIATDRQAARTLLAAEITHQLHNQRTFGQRKLQKVIYLAEHVARLTSIQGDYLRDAAGPHDRQLMNKVEGEMQKHQWYERIERETVGHAYRPLSQAGQHRQAYSSAWLVAERAAIEQVIELMRDWDTDRCEMTVTLYAAWNDFILEGRPVSDDAIVDEVMHSWNDTKLRFGKTEWLAVLAEMKKHKILVPTGFGKRTKGGMLSLPGFE